MNALTRLLALVLLLVAPGCWAPERHLVLEPNIKGAVRTVSVGTNGVVVVAGGAWPYSASGHIGPEPRVSGSLIKGAYSLDLPKPPCPACATPLLQTHTAPYPCSGERVTHYSRWDRDGCLYICKGPTAAEALALPGVHWAAPEEAQ